MRLAPVLALAAVAVGCGSSEDPERAEVRAYLERVNAVQKGQTEGLERANTVLRGYAQGKPVGAPALEGIIGDITRARGAVAAVKPPAKARDVHASLLRIYDVDAELAEETLRMVRYQEAAPRALAPLDRASVRLRRDLDRARLSSTQARALSRFAGTVDRSHERLDALDVPALLAPAHKAQLARLESTRLLSRKLRTAVAERDSKRVAKLLLRFRRSARSQTSERALTKRGLAAYTTRLDELTTAQVEFGRAQARLNRSLRST
ncbi:hypothetical protein DVA67_029370 [Solirubrobacter sp. CPCC 204708]|uniref:Lipoprotein n=1 Tax=Solirubrobacter deserti TaxID=2282478 RepID=A0ABT4RMP7_9ACTN|nr:hypothetical protein [Solirubrobacter deserti]MBE2320112.1 hypothetical protein [Solirubrobacter deserti]MDA0139830.1 hypothetical protein [Solirubrobacter deserti]